MPEEDRGRVEESVDAPVSDARTAGAAAVGGELPFAFPSDRTQREAAHPPIQFVKDTYLI